MGMDVDYIAGKDAIDKLDDAFKKLPHGERGDAADEIIEFAENFKKKYAEHKSSISIDEIPRGTPVVAKYGLNKVLNKPFEHLYEFGYYTKHGCVVYNKGECNMQDAHAFELDQIRIATREDLNELFWGNQIMENKYCAFGVWYKDNRGTIIEESENYYIVVASGWGTYNLAIPKDSLISFDTETTDIPDYCCSAMMRRRRSAFPMSPQVGAGTG